MSPPDGAHSNKPDLEGRLESLSLFDVCQFLMINRKTGVLRVGTRPDLFTLSLLEGQIQDVTGPSMQTGVKALHKALRQKSGGFEFNSKSVPPLGAFDESTDSLLLEAARQMDETGDGLPSAELERRQQRAQELVRLLEQVTRPSQSEDKNEVAEGWIQSLENWGARLHTDESGQAWLETSDGRTRSRGVDPVFRDKLLEYILGPKRDRLLEGSRGLLQTPRGEIWWARSGPGPKLLTLGRVQDAYPSLASLGVDVPELSSPITVVEAATVAETSLFVGAIFQDSVALGDGAGALLSPWPLARPVGRLGPTLWIPGASSESLHELKSMYLGGAAPILAADPPMVLPSRAIAELVGEGWRILLGVPRVQGKLDRSRWPSGSVLLRLESDPVSPGRFRIADSRRAA